MSTSGKRSHSRRNREYNVTEDSSEDSDSSVRSTEYDWRDKKTKEKRSHRRPDDDDRRRSSYKKERRSKRDKKGSREKKRKKKRKKKGTPEILEGQDGDPLHQNKEPQAKQSCLAFISSTRLTPTAASHSVAGRELPSAAGDRAERMQLSSSNNVQGTQRSLAPMSKEEYERIRNTIRRVVDPETGRSRLIRGEGEVLEEIVSRDRHKEINKLATRGDGEWFLRGTGLNRQT